jgi:hypothetical protein
VSSCSYLCTIRLGRLGDEEETQSVSSCLVFVLDRLLKSCREFRSHSTTLDTSTQNRRKWVPHSQVTLPSLATLASWYSCTLQTKFVLLIYRLHVIFPIDIDYTLWMYCISLTIHLLLMPCIPQTPKYIDKSSQLPPKHCFRVLWGFTWVLSWSPLLYNYIRSWALALTNILHG